MRQIIIPQKALDRHEETLGKALLGYLQRLSEGCQFTVKADVAKNEKKDEGNVGKYCRDREYDKELFCRKHCNYSDPPCVRAYWKWVYEQFRDKHILTARPNILLEFAKDNLAKLENVGRFCGQTKELNGIIDLVSKSLFHFSSLRDGKVLSKRSDKCKFCWSNAKDNIKNWDGWSLAEFIRLLNVRYCPYCNAEIVGLIQRTNPNAKTPVAYSALDHILPQSKYPLLALSLYNLVPACTRCNSQLKHEHDDFDVEHWDPHKPFNALHPYVHNIHKWFRFAYRPSSVTKLFLDPQKSHQEPLSIDWRIPLPKECRTVDDESFYDGRTKNFTTQYELPGSYYDLYATEINEILKMEMICTPTFIEAMKKTYGMSDKDFNLAFRRTSLDPLEINKHRFGKLIIDLQKQIGYDDWPEEWETSHTVEALKKEIREAHQAAWEKRKRMIERKVRIKFSKTK